MVSGFVFQISEFGFGVSGSGFQVLGSDFGFRVAGFRFGISAFRVSGSGLSLLDLDHLPERPSRLLLGFALRHGIGGLRADVKRMWHIQDSQGQILDIACR